jgi:Leucine-rich repeat (LRR) protein
MINNQELLNQLNNQIESLHFSEGGIINLINLIEDEGLEVTDNLIIYLWNNIKDNNHIKAKRTINNIPTSIIVY